MTVRIWSSDVSAWEAGGGGGSGGSGGRGGLGGLSPPLPSRHEIARIRTQHRSNVFQAFFVDPTDEGSELLTCAADGAVRSLSVPRAQRDRLLLSPTTSQGGRGGGANNNDAAAASATSTTTVESRLLFRHCGRAHKMALVPGSPCELATCGEDGVVATFDLRERGRGGGGGGGGANSASAPPSPLTAAVGPAALSAAARVPGGSCFPPSDRACSRAAPAGGGGSGSGGIGSGVDVSLYSVSFDVSRPWLLAVGGDASERGGSGEVPACVVIDRRMLSIPPSEAFRRQRGGGGGGGGGGTGGRGGRGRGGRGRGAREDNDDNDDDEDEDEDEDDEDDFFTDGDDGTGPDPAAGTIFARGALLRELLDSTGRAGRSPLGTLDSARVSSFSLSFFLLKFFFFFSLSSSSLPLLPKKNSNSSKSCPSSAPLWSRARPCQRTWAPSAAAAAEAEAPRGAARLAATRGSALEGLPSQVRRGEGGREEGREGSIFFSLFSFPSSFPQHTRAKNEIKNKNQSMQASRSSPAGGGRCSSRSAPRARSTSCRRRSRAERPAPATRGRTLTATSVVAAAGRVTRCGETAAAAAAAAKEKRKKRRKKKKRKPSVKGASAAGTSEDSNSNSNSSGLLAAPVRRRCLGSRAPRALTSTAARTWTTTSTVGLIFFLFLFSFQKKKWKKKKRTHLSIFSFFFFKSKPFDKQQPADPDGCRRFSGSGYRNEATIKAGEELLFTLFF